MMTRAKAWVAFASAALQGDWATEEGAAGTHRAYSEMADKMMLEYDERFPETDKEPALKCVDCGAERPDDRFYSADSQIYCWRCGPHATKDL